MCCLPCFSNESLSAVTKQCIHPRYDQSCASSWSAVLLQIGLMILSSVLAHLHINLGLIRPNFR